MNIKEKFNNLFKYPAFYLLSLSGWILIPLHIYTFKEAPSQNIGAIIYSTIFQSQLYFIFYIITLGISCLLHTIFEIYDYRIKTTFFQQNIIAKTITNIGVISFLLPIIILLFFILLVIITKIFLL